MTAEVRHKQFTEGEKPRETSEKLEEVYVAPKFPKKEISHNLGEIAAQRHMHRLWEQYLREQSTGPQETGNPAIDQTVSPTKEMNNNAIINISGEIKDQTGAADFEERIKNAATEVSTNNQ